jgi:hypothetical protein
LWARGPCPTWVPGPSTSPLAAMKKLVVVFAAVGVVSGFLFALGPFIFGTPSGSLGSFVAPVVLGLLLVATHRLNWKRLHDHAQVYPRMRLLGFNLAFLVFFLIGFVVMYRIGANFRNQSWRVISFLVLWPLPLAVNALYLCLPEAARSES